MKTTRRLQGLLAAVFLVMAVAGSAQATFYIPYIYGGNGVIGGGDDNIYPKVAHFDWISTTNSYGYNTSFTYTNGGNLSYQIAFTLYAPDNWNSANTGTTYTGYRPSDAGLVRGSTLTPKGGGSGAFNDVYSYFYRITNTGTAALNQIQISYSNATLNDFGYGTVAKIPTMADFGGTLVTSLGLGGLTTGQTSTIYLTSQSWYGWDNATGLGAGPTIANGNLPSPNPEASTVALYVVGLAGMAGYTYMKKRRAEVL